MNRIRGKLLLLLLVVSAAAALVLPTSAAAGWTWDYAVDSPDGAAAMHDGAAGLDAPA